MDCPEFRRRLGSDPQVRDRDARAHLQGCAACGEATASAQAFDGDLARAMAVPVPPGLADRILLARLTDVRARARTQRRRYAWLGLATAASMALAIGIGSYPRTPASLADLVVAHVNGAERDALQLSAPVPAASIERAFADRGVTLRSVPSGVSYVHPCPVGDYRSVHMVMPGVGSPVSVLYIVNRSTDAPADFQRAALQGREVPVGDGTLVLLARTGERFDAIEQVWRNAIDDPPQIAAGSR